ncbi:MAG: cupredoxin domain-containing protein [Ilumatobacteraceae bacterium]
MALRFTPTLAICAIGAAITGGLLALPPADDDEPVVPAAPAGAPTPAASILIVDFSFGDPRTVAAGAVVQVSNSDAASHTLTAKDGAFDSGIVDDGVIVSFIAPGTPGVYDFFCEIHPSMTGSLVVN